MTVAINARAAVRREIGGVERVAREMAVGRERIAVIPHGVSPRFSPSADPAPARAAHSIDGDYALYVGTRISRKNVTALRDAQRALAARGVELVAAGSGRAYMQAGE